MKIKSLDIAKNGEKIYTDISSLIETYKIIHFDDVFRYNDKDYIVEEISLNFDTDNNCNITIHVQDYKYERDTLI